jgi:hypothetical protein
MSALDGLRNVRDGVSTPDQVIAIIEANIEHCRGVTAPAQPVLHGLSLAVIGLKHFGNPIPKEWYAAAKELLSTAPTQQPLTDEQIHKLAASLMYTKLDYNLAFARAIEAHIKGASL